MHPHTQAFRLCKAKYTQLKTGSKRPGNLERMEQKTWLVYNFGKRNVFRLDLNESKEGFCPRGRGRSFRVNGPKTEKAREPTVESQMRGIWRLRVSEAERRVRAERVKLKTVTIDMKFSEHRCHVLAAGLTAEGFCVACVLTALVTQGARQGAFTRLDYVFRVQAHGHQLRPRLQRTLYLVDNHRRASQRFCQTKLICDAVGNFVVEDPGHPHVEMGYTVSQFAEEVFKFTEREKPSHTPYSAVRGERVMHAADLYTAEAAVLLKTQSLPECVRETKKDRRSVGGVRGRDIFF